MEIIFYKKCQFQTDPVTWDFHSSNRYGSCDDKI